MRSEEAGGSTDDMEAHRAMREPHRPGCPAKPRSTEGRAPTQSGNSKTAWERELAANDEGRSHFPLLDEEEAMRKRRAPGERVSMTSLSS